MLAKCVSLVMAYLERCEERVQLDGAQTALRDPIATRVIGSHYALSHYCAGLYLQSRLQNSTVLRQRAESVLEYIRVTHDQYSKEEDYHQDFNNFAWAVLLALDKRGPDLLSNESRRTCSALLCNTSDSRHNTLNWLPMRAFNRTIRATVLRQRVPCASSQRLVKRVLRAKGDDGLFEDSLTPGMTACPQYHAYTLAVLLLGQQLGCLSFDASEVRSSLGVLLRHIDPDGDFNYYGRGTNQLFAYGPMVFLLKNMHCATAATERTLLYVARHLPECLKNNGIQLENAYAYQHVTWRYYHYVTVYVAHLFFWLSLAQSAAFSFPAPAHTQPDRSSLCVFRANRIFAAIFNGRRRFLAERGPLLCNLWMQPYGSVFKGPLGPFADCPGDARDHICATAVVSNYCGPIAEGVVGPGVLSVAPVWPESLTIRALPKGVAIRFTLRKAQRNVQFNLPVFTTTGLSADDVNRLFAVHTDSGQLSLFRVASVIGPYHELDVYRTKHVVGVSHFTIAVKA